MTINMPDAPRTYHVVKGRGQAVVKTLALKAKEKGGIISAASAVKQVLKGHRGPSGIVVESDGKGAEVACRAVVIASGGYANNAEWIRKYTGLELDRTVTPMGNVGKMGDGIRMAWEMGAAEEGMGVLHLIRDAVYAVDTSSDTLEVGQLQRAAVSFSIPFLKVNRLASLPSHRHRLSYLVPSPDISPSLRAGFPCPRRQGTYLEGFRPMT